MDSLDTLSRLVEDGHDIEACRYCEEQAVGVVLDQRIGTGTVPGNKYRRKCLNPDCEAWNPMTSKDYFDAHPLPHVLPADEDPDDPAALVPLDEYDDPDDEYADRLKAIQDRLNRSNDDTDAADGNDSPEPETGAVAVNRFRCDHCEEAVTGYPERCPNCDALFRWGADASADDREDAHV
ncbi:hypothetical protein [Haladaptatus paucihalophilus]|uniref:hypothetical protein n=1 Tax=Haladaptatus paucihalophilus TaxID=367189 RepID=UPI00037B7690|nr:hypothetical protein [Haladaptatus paucihalophilus]